MTAPTTTTTTTTTTGAESLKDCVVFGSHKVQGACGKKVISKEKLKLVLEESEVQNDNVSKSELTWFPSSALVSGSKTNTRLSSLYSKKMSRLFEEFGVKVNGLTLVTKKNLPAFLLDKEALENDFWADVETICRNYFHIIESHKLANPELADLIEESALELDVFKSRFLFKVPPALDISFHDEADVSEFEAEALDNLYKDLAKVAMDAYKVSFAGKSEVTQKVKSPFKRMLDKLVDLSFLDEGLIKVSDNLKAILAKMPAKGKMTEVQFRQLAQWALIMSNPEAIKAEVEAEEVTPIEAVEIEAEEAKAEAVVNVPAEEAVVEAEKESQSNAEDKVDAVAQEVPAEITTVIEDDLTKIAEAAEDSKLAIEAAKVVAQEQSAPQVSFGILDW